MNLIGIELGELAKNVGSAVDHLVGRLSASVSRWMRNKRIKEGDSSAVIERLTRPSPRDSLG